jgi:hypothetical protein
MNGWNHFVKDLFSSEHAMGKPWGDTHPMTWASGIYQMVQTQDQDDEILEYTQEPMDMMDPETLLIHMESMDLTMDDLVGGPAHMDVPEPMGDSQPCLANGCWAEEYLVPMDLEGVGVAGPIPLRRGVEPSIVKQLSLLPDMRRNWNRGIHKGCNSKPRVKDFRRTAA